MHNNTPERSAATVRDMRLPAAAFIAAGAAIAIATAAAVASAARPPAPNALHAAAPGHVVASALQQQPTSGPPPTATVARPLRPALFPL
ncbi:MAG: hypothetical protein ABI780_07870, partial [Ardenticatenales bacterium]